MKGETRRNMMCGQWACDGEEWILEEILEGTPNRKPKEKQERDGGKLRKQ